jgi:hypothetical protein
MHIYAQPTCARAPALLAQARPPIPPTTGLRTSNKKTLTPATQRLDFTTHLRSELLPQDSHFGAGYDQLFPLRTMQPGLGFRVYRGGDIRRPDVTARDQITIKADRAGHSRRQAAQQRKQKNVYISQPSQ